MKFLSRWLPSLLFKSSGNYWDQRYRLGGNSGAGSYGKAASYKAEVLNQFVSSQAIKSVIEFGCGDGNQLTLAKYPSYAGFDVSPTAINRCRELFSGDPTKHFDLMSNYAGEQADLSLSLDVLYHLVEDDVFESYLKTLFNSARHYVIIYSSDTEKPVKTMAHVRLRNVSAETASRFPGFRRRTDLESTLPPPVVASRGIATKFLIFQRI